MVADFPARFRDDSRGVVGDNQRVELSLRRSYGRNSRIACSSIRAPKHCLATHYIHPGTPDHNANIEPFNRRYRIEVLNAHLSESVATFEALFSTGLQIGERLMFVPRPSAAG